MEGCPLSADLGCGLIASREITGSLRPRRHVRAVRLQAISYSLSRWPELTRFAEPGYGHILIDNNPTERQIRPSKLGLKNWLFVGHPDAGDRPAVLYSVFGTCKLIGVDPWAYLNWALPGLAAASNQTQALFTPDRFPGTKA